MPAPLENLLLNCFLSLLRCCTWYLVSRLVKTSNTTTHPPVHSPALPVALPPLRLREKINAAETINAMFHVTFRQRSGRRRIPLQQASASTEATQVRRP